MKSALLVLTVALSLAANDFDTVKQLVEMIAMPRTGAGEARLSSLKNPFEKPQQATKARRDGNATAYIPPPPRSPKLKAILNQTALLDDKWVKAGDRYNGFQIVAIEAKSVEIKYDQMQRTLKLFQERRVN